MEHFFVQLVVIWIAARLCGEVVVRFKIPAVMGELLAGVLIGPSLLNWIHPSETIDLLAEIGIILLLFEVGLETDLGRLAKTSFKPFLVAFGGVAAPLALGYLLSHYYFGLPVLISLFIGATMTATSIGITLRVLNDLNKRQSEEVQIVLGAAVIDDILGIMLLSLLYEFSTGGGIHLANTGKVLLYILIYIALAPLAARFISKAIRTVEKRTQIPGLLPTSIVSLILFFAWLSHAVGAPILLGGFAAGLALSRRFFLPLGPLLHTSQEFANRIEEQMKPIIHLFTPIFFVSIGLSLNLKLVPWESSTIWLMTGLLLLTAVIGKVVSGWLLIKEPSRIRWLVGLAMVPRGEVGLIFAEVGLDTGIFNNDIYASLILVIALTTLLAPFALRLFYSIYPEEAQALNPVNAS